MFDKLGLIISAIRKSWSKILLFFFLLALFSLILFPLDDLGDLVSSQVAKMTRNTVYVQFEKMGIGVFPKLGIELKQVHIEMTNMAPLSANELTVSPSLSGLLHQKPFGQVAVRGLLKGDAEVSLKSGRRTDDNQERFQLDVSARKMSLDDIRVLAKIPLLLRGQLFLNLTNGQIDPLLMGIRLPDRTGSEFSQPDMDVDLSIDKFEMPAGNLPIMGGLTVPDLRMSRIHLKGRLSNGEFVINEGILGNPQDEVNGSLKARMGLTMQSLPGPGGQSRIVPVFGAYSVEIDLRIKKSFQNKAQLILATMDGFITGMAPGSKTETADGVQYKLKLSGQNLAAPPRISSLR